MARTRAQDFEEKQLAILDYAANVLATLGVDKASMSQIAGQARISKALLYHYYPSKDALVFAIIFTHLEELDLDLEASDDPAMEPSVRLKFLVGVVLEHYRGAGDRHKVQLNAMSLLTDEQKQAITEVERRIVRRFAGVVRQISPRLDNQRAPPGHAGDHVALWHDELDGHVVQGRRPHQPRGLCRGPHHAHP